MKSIFAGTLANRNKGFSLFYNLSGTLYWLEVNASHPDILKDGTYQIMPTLNISASDAVCNSAPPVAYPDLTVLSVSANPSAACSGQSVTVSYTVSNIGNAAASNVQIGIYSAGSLAKTYSMNLAAGASGTGTYTYTADSNPRTITVVADYNGAIAESNENNNQAGLTVSVGNCALPLAGRKIMLDPGHMPNETDRINSGEYYATHNISRVLKPMLENLGATVYETPATYTLSQRTALANSINPEIYVSIHFNAGVSNADGLEAFYGEKNPAGGTGSKEGDIALCKKLVPEVQKIINSKLRSRCGNAIPGILPDRVAINCTSPNYSLWVVRQTKMPACLIEMEFITAQKAITFNGKNYSNYKELFLSADYTNAAAEALKNGILNYFGVNGTVPPAQPYDKVAFTSTGELYIPSGVFSGDCYINDTGAKVPCGTIAGKTAKISGAFDGYANKYDFNIKSNSGCGLGEAAFKSAFESSANMNKGFSVFFLVGTTKYWMGVNPSHPSVLKDRTYQILPEAGTTITTQQATC